MKFAVVGASGFIGSRLVHCLQRSGRYVQRIGRGCCNLYDVAELSACLRDCSADFVISSAGYTGKPNVDACEIHKADCLSGNAILPGRVREACESIGIPFAHVSSGCIFTGEKAVGSGWTEQDPANFSFRQNNCSFYSGCKALGEELLEGCETCYVWRLRMPFDHRDSSKNYLSKLLRYDRLLDARNSLTYLDDFAKSCVQCVMDGLPFGTYNLTNPGSVTTREVARMLRGTIAPDREFDFFDDEDEFMRQAAVAPRSNCVLDSSKAVNAGLPMRPIREAIADSLERWQWEQTQTGVKI